MGGVVNNNNKKYFKTTKTKINNNNFNRCLNVSRDGEEVMTKGKSLSYPLLFVFLKEMWCQRL